LRSDGSRAYTNVPRSAIKSTPPLLSSTEHLSLCAWPPVPPWIQLDFAGAAPARLFTAVLFLRGK
jgi:hypothetical protein